MLADDHFTSQRILALLGHYDVLIIATISDTCDGLLMVSSHLRANCALSTTTLATDDLHLDLLAAQLLAFLHFIMVVAQSNLLHLFE